MTKCGTYAGYRKHHNDKTKPCIECLAAASKYNRLRYAKNNRAHDSAKYRAANLDKVRAREREKNRKRRAKKKSTLALDYNELQVIATYGIDCYLCGLEINFMSPRKSGMPGWEKGLHIDHVLPISKGGSDTLENVRPTHGLCNLNKHARDVTNGALLGH